MAIADLAHRVLAETGAGSVTGVGMGLPGPLAGDEVGDSAILPGWIGARPEEMLRGELGLPVRVDNDANQPRLPRDAGGRRGGADDDPLGAEQVARARHALAERAAGAGVLGERAEVLGAVALVLSTASASLGAGPAGGPRAAGAASPGP